MKYNTSTNTQDEWLESCIYRSPSGKINFAPKLFFGNEKSGKTQLRQLVEDGYMSREDKEDVTTFTLTKKGMKKALKLYHENNPQQQVLTDDNTISVIHTDEIGINEYRSNGYNIQLSM